MNPNSHSGRTAVLTAVLITTASLFLWGCTSNRVEDVPNKPPKAAAPAGAPASLSPKDQETVDKAWARYLTLNSIYVKASQTGAYDWNADPAKRPMYEYAAGKFLSTLERDLDFMREQGIVRTGEPKITLRRVVSVSATSILVESCVDDSATDAINKATRKSVAAPSQNKIYPVTLRAGLYADNAWRWVESFADRTSTC